MMVRLQFGRMQLLSLACALLAGCDAQNRTLRYDDRTSVPAVNSAESGAGGPCSSEVEPRLLAEVPQRPGTLIPVGFRSRQPAQTFSDPEVSLGSPEESLTPIDPAPVTDAKPLDQKDPAVRWYRTGARTSRAAIAAGWCRSTTGWTRWRPRFDRATAARCRQPAIQRNGCGVSSCRSFGSTGISSG